MEFIIIVILVIVLLLMHLYQRYRRKKLQNLRNVFVELNNKLNIHYFRGNMFNEPRLSGEFKDIRITIKKYNGNELNNHFKIFIRHRVKIKGLFRISGESFDKFTSTIYAANLLASTSKSMRPVFTGISSFDEKIHISQTKRCNVYTLLNREVRDMLLSLRSFSAIFKISNTIFELYVPQKVLYDVKSMSEHFENIANISNRLCAIIDERRALIKNIRMENDSSIKEKFIRLLVEKYPLDNEIKEILRTVLKEGEFNNQIFAAEYLGNEGTEFIFNMLNSQKVSDTSSIIAIIKFLKQHFYDKSASLLMNIYKSTENMNIKLEILKAYKIFGLNELSDFLVQRLKSDESEIKEMAIKALSTCGAVDSVEPLIKVAKNSLNPFLRDTISKTIVQIQSRLGDVETGWLSIDELKEKEGGLSLEKGAGEGSLSVDGNNDNTKDKEEN